MWVTLKEKRPFFQNWQKRSSNARHFPEKDLHVYKLDTHVQILV